MKKHLLLLIPLLLVVSVGGFFVYSLNTKEETPLEVAHFKNSNKEPIKKDQPIRKNQNSKVLVGYIQDFRDPTIIDYSSLTHIIFSFAHPSKDGDVLFTSKNALGNLRHIVKTAKQHDTKVLLAVGGWFHMNGGESYEYFKAAISNSTSRKKLVNELISIVDREQLDGIDIDFEHPRSKADAKNLTLFIKELSSKLHPNNKELTIAVYAKIHAVTLTEVGFINYQPDMFNYVDYVNIMAYDGHWDDGYHAENLSPYPYTEQIVKYWEHFDDHDLSREKLVLGVPFYAQPKDSSIKQVSYNAIINHDSSSATKDTIQMNGTTYYYNGSKMMEKKTTLALDHGFGGMMIWELGLDANGKYSLTHQIYETIKSSNPENYKYYSTK